VISLAGHPDPERFVAEFSGSDRTVAEYLLAEMLDRQSDDVQQLLLRTSLLDRVNGELADLLTGRLGSERILLGLEDANASVVSLDLGRTRSLRREGDAPMTSAPVHHPAWQPQLAGWPATPDRCGPAVRAVYRLNGTASYT
jgi:hypothetical protein